MHHIIITATIGLDDMAEGWTDKAEAAHQFAAILKPALVDQAEFFLSCETAGDRMVYCFVDVKEKKAPISVRYEANGWLIEPGLVEHILTNVETETWEEFSSSKAAS